MVGSEETAEAVMTSVNAVGPVFLELLTQRGQLMLQQRKIDSETEPLKKAQQIGNHSQALIAAFDHGITSTREVAKLLPNAILAVRKDIDLPLDRLLLERLWRKQFEKVGHAWARAKEKFKIIGNG
jgi:hypothetical protein